MSSSSMDSATFDVVVQTLGQKVSQLIFQLSLTSLFFGAYALTIGISIRLVLSKTQRPTRMKVLLGLNVMMFAFTLTYYALVHAIVIMFVRDNMTKTPPRTIKEIVNINLDLDSAADVFCIVNLAIGDLVLLWRCWAICPQSRSLRWITSFTFTLTALTFICTLVLKIITNYRVYYGVGVESEGFAKEVYGQTTSWALSIALSLFTNMIATGYVGALAWKQRKFIKEANIGSSSQTFKIILLMFESGLLYCLLQICYLLLQFIPNRTLPFLVDGKGVVFYILAVLTSWYPILILMIVSMERSFAGSTVHVAETDSPGKREENGVKAPTGALSTMRFAGSETPVDENVSLERKKESWDGENV